METPQDDRAATYAHRLTKADGTVDWSRSAAAIHNQIRGLHPWPHASAFVDGHRVILLRSRALDTQAPGSPAPGTIVEAHGDRLTVATGEGVLQLLTVQPEGRRPMTAREFLAGRSLAALDRFTAAP